MKTIFIFNDYKKNIHESHPHYICEAHTLEDVQIMTQTVEEMELENPHIHHIEFPSYEDANYYFEKYENDLYKNYTKLINDEGIPSGGSHRCVIVFIRDELVAPTGYYLLSLNDYILIRNISNGITLPVNNELLLIQQYRSFIPYTKEILEKLPQLKISQDFFNENFDKC